MHRPAAAPGPRSPMRTGPTPATPLHLWTQVVGKVKLALSPLTNHWWGIVLYVTARGLTTGAMAYRGRTLQIDFDFCAHELILRTSDAREQRIRRHDLTPLELP
jgi:hypothetical protein